MMSFNLFTFPSTRPNFLSDSDMTAKLFFLVGKYRFLLSK